MKEDFGSRLRNPQHMADGHDAINNRPRRDEANHRKDGKFGHIIAAQFRAHIAAKFVECRGVPATRRFIGSSRTGGESKAERL